MVITPDKVLYSAEVESGQYYWVFHVGSGGYGGVTWDHRGVSTPVMNYHSIKIDQYSIANILQDGNAHPSRIETYDNHGGTPPAFGWMYQGSPSGFGHIAIVFSWGESSDSNQSTANPNGATPGHALRYNSMYPAEGSLSLSDGTGADSGTIYQAYNGTPSVNDPSMLIYGGYKYSYYFYDMREYGSISADSSIGDRGVYDSILEYKL